MDRPRIQHLHVALAQQRGRPLLSNEKLMCCAAFFRVERVVARLGVGLGEEYRRPHLRSDVLQRDESGEERADFLESVVGVKLLALGSLVRDQRRELTERSVGVIGEDFLKELAEFSVGTEELAKGGQDFLRRLQHHVVTISSLQNLPKACGSIKARVLVRDGFVERLVHREEERVAHLRRQAPVQPKNALRLEHPLRSGRIATLLVQQQGPMGVGRELKTPLGGCGLGEISPRKAGDDSLKS
mmetsp:Transcript_25043/g.56348  ORF Transcript_25043/g.56348 Transcript_25043/m.56348 type:complete len:243 (-) Transcript_25043:399-1127(-)